MPHRLALAAVALAAAAAPARAQLDPEPKAPYVWRVVVKAAPHPLLTPAFRDQLKRDVSAALQPALGPLGAVEVIDLADVPRDRWEALWQQFDDKGFPALDASRDLSGAKTHFLTVDYRDGRYHLAARQHDGFSGLASPVVRTQTVRAPELVGRTAGLMLDPDFGLAGTAEPVPGSKDEVKVTVRGGQLGPLDKAVKAGDVFAVSQVFKTNRPAPPPVRSATGKIIAPPPGSVPPPGLTATPRAFTLLKVAAVNKDGTLRCTALSRFQTALPASDKVVGYRCLKLGTVESPVAVRLVTSDPAYQKSVGRVSVRGSEAGFGPPEAKDVFDFKDGVFRSARPLANVACVTVSLGPTRSVLFPLPVLGPDPVALPFEINPKLEEEAEYTRRVLAAAARVADARVAQGICFEATAKLVDRQKNADALARAKGGFEAADATDKNLSDDLARLRELPSPSADAAKLVAHVEGQLAALRKFNEDLARHVTTLTEVVRRENDPTVAAVELQAHTLTTRITFLLGRGDVDEAIAAYGQLAALLPADADVRARRDKLKADWAPKGDAHARAREYLLKTWPGLPPAELEDSLKRVEAEVEVCIKSGDRLGLRKLLTVFSGALAKLSEYVAALDPAADAKAVASANKAGQALAALEARITAFVAKE
jgi:tetratricopeptide (TPR) repeat protein